MRLTRSGGHHAATIGSGADGANGASALSCRCRLTELGRYVGPGRPGWTVREPDHRTNRGADEPALEDGHREVSFAGENRRDRDPAPAARQRVQTGGGVRGRSSAIRSAQFPAPDRSPKPWSHASPRRLGNPWRSRLPLGGRSAPPVGLLRALRSA